MRSIVIPLNHESGAMLAVECAAQVGRAAGVDIVMLVNVKSPLHKLRAREQLEKARAVLEGHDMRVSTVRLEGRKAKSVASLCCDGTLIVMAKLARTDRASWEVGSTTTDLLKLAPCPILVVTEQLTPLAHPIFAYNGSPQSRHAMTTALEMLAPGLIERGSVLTVTADEQMAERLDAEVRAVAAARGVELDPYYCRDGRPGEVLLERRSQCCADLVVMGAYGRRWVSQLVFGSTTEAMLRRCPVPIWMAS